MGEGVQSGPCYGREAMLFAQFPLEGPAVKFMLGRGVKVSAAIGQMVSVHMVCTLVLWLVAGAAA